MEKGNERVARNQRKNEIEVGKSIKNVEGEEIQDKKIRGGRVAKEGSERGKEGIKKWTRRRLVSEGVKWKPEEMKWAEAMKRIRGSKEKKTRKVKQKRQKRGDSEGNE